MENQKNKLDGFSYDKLDLITVVQALWQQKKIVFITSFIFPLSVFLHAIFTPVESDYYYGSATIELALIQVEDCSPGRFVQVVEPLEDLVQVLPALTLIDVNRPIGVTRIIELNAVGESKEQVLKKLNDATSIIESRHNKILANLNHINIVSPTTQVGEAVLRVVSPGKEKESRVALALVISTLVGFFMGFLIVFIRLSIQG